MQTNRVATNVFLTSYIVWCRAVGAHLQYAQALLVKFPGGFHGDDDVLPSQCTSGGFELTGVMCHVSCVM